MSFAPRRASRVLFAFLALVVLVGSIPASLAGAQSETPVLIFPNDTVVFTPGALFDFRVEVHAEALPADFAVTINGEDASTVSGIDPVQVSWEFGTEAPLIPSISWIWREVVLEAEGEYLVEVTADGAVTSATWTVLAAVEEAPIVTGDDIPADLVDPLAVSGDVVSAGSSTVFPLAERMAERFNDEGFAGQVTIDSIGSGGGFERFCSTGETDVSNASRPIKDAEVANCEAIGRTPIEFRVGTDALAIAVSAENDFLTDVTMEELAAIFSTAETWAEVNADWPVEPIQRFIPGTDSGTFDYFVEEVFEEDEGPILDASNLQLSEDDNVLVQGIQASKYAIGFFGFAYYQENADALQALSIGGIAPTGESAEDGSYPLARPLFIYSTADIIQEKPQVAAYIGFFLKYVNQEIVDVGYFPSSEAALSGGISAWMDAMGIGGSDAMAADEDAMDAMDAIDVASIIDPLSVTGDVVSAGSSTVFPLAERMAERFNEEGFAGQVTIDSIGSGGGFERFCSTGETDVSNASRPIKEAEVENCLAIDRDPIEFRVGTDALAIAVSAENDFLTDVTMEELAAIFSTAETWAEVNADWPEEPIQRFIPGTDSGTFDYFVEEVFEEDEGPILDASNLQLSEDDNVLVQGIQASPYAVGFFGFAYYQENADALQALSIDTVAPTGESAEDGSYPLARPLFIYSTADIIQAKPQVAAYIGFFLTFVNEEIVDVGYFPSSEVALGASYDAWLTAVGGSADAMPADADGEAMDAMDGGDVDVMSVIDPLGVTGDVVSAGSSTVFPLAERMAERFNEEGFAGQVTIDSIGSGGGFERFCSTGETDVSNASRPIKDAEVANCEAIGRTPIEFRVGTDALAIAVSAENDFVTDITMEQLAAIFSGAELWSDVDPGWPVEPIQRFIPGTDSGTFDYFVEEVFEEDEGPILDASNLQLSEDDNVLVQGIQASKYAIGFFGFAYYQENADALQALSIGGVAPTGESAEDGTYPLARPLFIYSTADIIQEKPQVAAYIGFFLTYVNEEIVEVGYFPSSEAALGASYDAWLTAVAP